MAASKSPEPTRGRAMYNFRLLVNLSYRRLKNFWWFEIKVFASASVVYMRFTKMSKITLWETFILILNVTSECWRDVRKKRHHLDVFVQSSGLRAPAFRFSATVKISRLQRVWITSFLISLGSRGFQRLGWKSPATSAATMLRREAPEEENKVQERSFVKRHHNQSHQSVCGCYFL